MPEIKLSDKNGKKDTSEWLLQDTQRSMFSKVGRNTKQISLSFLPYTLAILGNPVLYIGSNLDF